MRLNVLGEADPRYFFSLLFYWIALLLRVSFFTQNMSDAFFPVSYSILQADRLAAHIATRYPLDPIRTCRLWKRGMSDTYLVETTTDRYILRVAHAHWRSRDDVQFEMELLDFLHQQLLPVAHPLRTHHGDLLLKLVAPEGDRYATLVTYAPGEVPVGDFNQTQSTHLGRTLAQLHQATQQFQPSSDRQILDFDHLVDQSLDLILPQINNPSLITYLETTRTQLHEQLKSLPQTPPYWVICWGDPHSGNVHCEGDRQITLFDFDQCGYGWRAFDVAKFLQMALCSGMRYSVRDAFLAGYQCHQPLTDIEIAALTPLTQTAHLWRWGISLNRALLDEVSRLDNYYFLHRTEQLKMLGSHSWKPLQTQLPQYSS
ncbi:MAG: hypothetical protein RLZZ511_4090 [Cyanobacteriota bacterium]|jgi:Ser/Thr protein kinase RdoA (MazF antagonist)